MTRKIRNLSAVCRVLLVMALLLPVGTLASGSTGVTGADGRLTFDRLPPALYLVLRTEAAPENAAYAADPFLLAAGGGLFMLGLALRRQKPGGGKPDGPA